jgi:Secretion system C-terminal sorting domain
VIIYPNPATSSLYVAVPYAGQLPCKIEVLDMSGRLLKSIVTGSTEERLDIESVPKGLYMLRLSFKGTAPMLRRWVKA